LPPLFSIITICLNCKDKLIDTAASLSNQTFKDYEYIIKDGVSSDGTQDIINNVNADIVVSAHDTGIFDAMNQALELSKGEYIHFLNAGDLLHDSKVLADIAKKIHLSTKKADLYYGDVVKPYARRKYLFHPEKISGYYLFSRGLCHQSWFLKREVYITMNGFNIYYKEKNIELAGDYLLLLQLFLVHNITSLHISRFAIIYEGGGVGSDLTTLKKRLQYERKVKKDLFGFIKFYLYQSIYLVENLFKKMIYNKYLFIFAAKINQYRANKIIKQSL